jgi:hypothetical protein
VSAQTQRPFSAYSSYHRARPAVRFSRLLRSLHDSRGHRGVLVPDFAFGTDGRTQGT